MKLELCAATETAVRLAVRYGFDRIELCQSLEIGGITPSAGFQRFAVQQVETHVLIRPRGGGFVYSEAEKEVMLLDIEASKIIGIQGIVAGALTEHGELDETWLEKVRDTAGGMQLTFHRAFDEIPDWRQALDQLVALGFHRILTSGQASDVLAGKERLREMKEYASGRIGIQAGGGVTPQNAAEVQRYASPDGIHFSGTTTVLLDEGSRYSTSAMLPDETKIREILKALGR